MDSGKKAADFLQLLDNHIFFNDLDDQLLQFFFKSLVKKDLDHKYLNEINGLENPTLEHIGLFIYNRLKELDLHLYKILVKRKSCGETFILKV